MQTPADRTGPGFISPPTEPDLGARTTIESRMVLIEGHISGSLQSLETLRHLDRLGQVEALRAAIHDRFKRLQIEAEELRHFIHINRL